MHSHITTVDVSVAYGALYHFVLSLHIRPFLCFEFKLYFYTYETDALDLFMVVK